MPLTQLDSVPALIVIDLQKGTTGLPAVHPIGDIIGNAAQLARRFRERGLPVILVNVNGLPHGRTDMVRPNIARPADWAELVPELEPHNTDCLVTKHCPGAFIGTPLQDILQQRGVTQVFLTGVITSLGVESTARTAYDYGYNVVFVRDAMTDRDAEVHRTCIEKIFPRMGEVTTTAGVLERL